MKLNPVFTFVFAVLLAWLPLPARAQVHLGIDVLQNKGFNVLQGKRVGLITNQTSVNARGVPTRVVLQKDPRVKLVALYTPEHGIDGKALAGKYVASRRDALTGLPAHSLYGPTRKPTPDMLAGIDVMLFDLQDIGSRSYTYISTMIRAMEACGECGKDFIVLDRPNPLGGWRINGPGIENKWFSFVGQVPVPYVHGMTAGEIARMAVGKHWLAANPRFTVIPMAGWNRNMVWANTGLRWIPTSPNIPNPSSPFYYAATGIYGSMAGVDVGIGGSNPFGYAGARGADAATFATWMRKQPGLSGIFFQPYANDGWNGVKLGILPQAQGDIVATNVYLMHYANKLASPSLVSKTTGDKRDIWFKVYGSDDIAECLNKGVPPEKIITSWRGLHRSFASARQPYLLYR